MTTHTRVCQLTVELLEAKLAVAVPRLQEACQAWLAEVKEHGLGIQERIYFENMSARLADIRRLTGEIGDAEADRKYYLSRLHA